MTKRIAGPRLPIVVTEIAYSQAAVCADMMDMSLRDYTEAALAVANAKALKLHQTRLYEAACKDALARNDIMPTRHEWQREQQPFVRRPAGVAENQAGRPSSRQPQKATERRPGQKRAAAPERPAATRSAASMARMREEPPFDRGEYRGTYEDMPGEDRWGPMPGEIEQPGPTRKHTATP